MLWIIPHFHKIYQRYKFEQNAPDQKAPLYKKLIMQFAIPKGKRDKFDKIKLMSIGMYIRQFLESLGENAGSYLEKIFGVDSISEKLFGGDDDLLGESYAKYT